MREDELRLALDIVSQGEPTFAPQAVAPLSPDVMASVRFQEAARSTVRQARPWARGSGVQGMGIGPRVTHGKVGPDLALRVYVERKRPMSKLKHPVPKRMPIPELGDIETDVVELGRLRPEVSTERERPAMPGCSIGHRRGTAGTLGCFVQKRGEDGERLYALSNSHVLALSGEAKIGDVILQPGKSDGGTATQDAVGTLEDFVPFEFGKAHFNTVDAAIARIEKKDADLAIRLIGVAPVGLSHTLKRGMRVHKVGRTTDRTIGEIADLDFLGHLPYVMPNGQQKLVGFRKQVLCTRYSDGGDSGSAVLNDNNRLIGLHFAGSVSGSLFHPIKDVFDALDLRLPDAE